MSALVPRGRVSPVHNKLLGSTHLEDFLYPLALLYCLLGDFWSHLLWFMPYLETQIDMSVLFHSHRIY